MNKGKTCKSCSEAISPHSAVFCDTHLIANRERGIKDRQRRKELGICRSCSEPLSEKSKNWCDKHRLQQNKSTLEASRAKRNKELCHDCDQEPRLPRKQRCVSCEAIYQEAKSKTCRRVGCEEPTEVKHFCRNHADEENAKLKARRQKLQQDNKCIFCFEVMDSADEGYVLCHKCRAKQRGQRTATA